MTPKIEWTRLSHDELEDLLKQGRAEGARRIRQLQTLLGLQQNKGPGRRAADPLDDIIGESSDPEDAAAADSSLS